MAWTNPRTWVALEIPTAAQLNTHIRDNENFLNSAHCCRVYHASNQNVADDAGYHALTFDSESFDTDAYHDAGSTPTKLIVPTGLDGYYLITGMVVFAANGTGHRDARIMLNGIASGTAVCTGRQQNAGAGTSARVLVTTTYRLSVSDYIELVALQDSGGGLNALGNVGDIDQTQLSLIRIGL